MTDIITYESELRVLEVDQQDIVKRIEDFGARKLFEGDLETRLYQIRTVGASGMGYKTSRLRWYKGVLYFTSSSDSNIFRPIDYTDIVVKEKRNPLVLVGKGKGPTPRSYREILQERRDGNQLDSLEQAYLQMGAQLVAWDSRHRVSYVRDIIRFELDTFFITEKLGERKLPLMLEVETPDDVLTREVVLSLGFTFEETIANGVPKVVDLKLGEIFGCYAKQNSEAE